MFHHDLLTDILLRLPIKSLLRFKCVSKHWLSLISSPQFRHSRQLLASSGIILYQTTDLIYHTSLAGSNSDPPFTSLSFIGDSAGIKILQSSNGLLLCCSSLPKVGKRRSYYVCNPSTQQFSTLPEADFEYVSKTISGVYLAFDSSSNKSSHYQVVSVRSCSSPSSPSTNNFQIVTYSSKTRAWRLSGSPFTAPDMMFDNGVLWNGSIHWLTPTGDSLYFNIDQERLATMPSLPSTTEIWSNRRLRYFGESGGHLHLIEVYGSTTQFHVFELEKDYSGWLPKYRVDIAPIVDAFPAMVRNYPDTSDSVFYAFSLLFVKEDEEDSVLLLHVPGEFLKYNLRSGTFKKLGTISTEANVAFQIGCFHAYQFTETLVGV